MVKDQEPITVTITEIGGFISDGVSGFKKDLNPIRRGVMAGVVALFPVTVLEAAAITNPHSKIAKFASENGFAKMLAFRTLMAGTGSGIAVAGIYFLKETPMPEVFAASVGLSLAYLGYIALDAVGAALVRRGGQK